MYVVGEEAPPLLAVTVTDDVRDTPPNEAVMVAVPALAAVTVDVVLELPEGIVAFAGTVATEVLEDERTTDVDVDTAPLIPIVRVCAFPGAKDTVAGVNDDNVGVGGVVPPPPDDGVPPVAINKCPR